MPRPSTIRLVEIAELLGVSKQRVHQLAGESEFLSGRRGRPRTALVKWRCRGVGEGLADREAVAMTGPGREMKRTR